MFTAIEDELVDPHNSAAGIIIIRIKTAYSLNVAELNHFLLRPDKCGAHVRRKGRRR